MSVAPENVKAYKAIVIIIIVIAGSPVIKSKVSMLVNRIKAGKLQTSAAKGVE
jgi:simple sugar transport system permease protein